MIPMEKITVIIPTRNRKHLLMEAISSVLNNKSRCYINIIISDNNSIDPISENEVELYEKKIKVNYLVKYFTIIDHFNVCMQYVKEGYVSIFADDDIMSPNYISSLERSLSINQEADVAIGNVARMSPTGEIRYHYDRQEKYKVQSTIGWSFEQKAIHYLCYGHKEEWAWTIIYGLYKAAILNSHSFSEKLNDPGALFVCDVTLNNNIVYDKNHGTIFKRDGGESNTPTALKFSSIMIAPWQTLKSAWLITLLIITKLRAEKQLSVKVLLALAIFWARNIGKSMILVGWCTARSIIPPQWLANIRPRLRRLIGG